jgi:hypothetical protein
MRRLDKTRLFERAIAALLSKPTVRAAARETGVSVRTLERWMKEPAFDALYRSTKGALIRSATSRLTANANDAAMVLKKIFSDKEATPAARVTAAATTIRLSLDAYELEELEQRIGALERQSDAL